MNKLSKRSLMALLLSLIMVATLAACGGGNKEPDEELPLEETGNSGFVFINPLNSDDFVFIEKAPKLAQKVQELKEGNSDSVGWLQVPNMDVDDIVLFYADDRNEYYLRRDYSKRYNWNGCFYADYRCKFDGTADGLSQNTVIYGHNLDITENQDSPMFGQILKYRDPDFARENPYIYFSLEEEDLVWEVFSVFYTLTSLNYNNPNPEPADFASLLDEVTARSLYLYDTPLSPDDKIVTLSTCTYEYTSEYPNNYRYVVMARLVGDDEVLKPEAAFTLNNNRKEP